MRESQIRSLLFTIFIDLLGFSIVIPILPVLSKEMGASNVQVGIIAGSYALMNFLFSPIWGNLSDRIGRRPIILISILITSSSYFIFAISKTLAMLLISRIIAGIGSANFGAAQAYIADITPPEDRAKSFGQIGAAFGLGFILGPLIGAFIVNNYDIKWIGYVTMALCIVNFIIAFFILKESNTSLTKGKIVFSNPFTAVWKGLKTPIVGKLMIISLLFIAAFSMMQITISVLWHEKYSLSKSQISGMFAFIGLASVIVQGFMVGPMTKRFGEYNLLTYGCVIMAAGLYIIPMAPHGVGFYFVEGLAIILIALANGCLTPSINSLISKSASPTHLGIVLGVAASVSSLGRVIGPYTGGFVYGMAQFMPYYIGALTMIIAWRLAKRFVTRYSNKATSISS